MVMTSVVCPSTSVNSMVLVDIGHGSPHDSVLTMRDGGSISLFTPVIVMPEPPGLLHV